MFGLTPYHFLLLVIAAIWGGGFVAQSWGMEHLGPFSFNAGRFVLATLSMIPVWWFMRQSKPLTTAAEERSFIIGGVLAGTFLFLGFSFQQFGLQYTNAGNAGFITSLYIVIVPLMLLLFGQATGLLTWVGLVLAGVGLYFLSVKEGLSIAQGDGIVLIGALFWAAHVVTLGWIAQRVSDVVSVSLLQFIVATAWGVAAMLWLEAPRVMDFFYVESLLSLLYAGILSSSIAFTLQLFAQRHVNATTAALLLSMEAVFALIAGYLLLAERITMQEFWGCMLMLVGILLSQWGERGRES